MLTVLWLSGLHPGAKTAFILHKKIESVKSPTVDSSPTFELFLKGPHKLFFHK